VHPSSRNRTLTDEDYSDLVKLVREAIGAEPYRIGPQ